MKKLAFVLICLGFLINSGVTRAEGNTMAAASEGVTIQDLGVENPGILPTNPFYFLKVWNRSFQRRITRDPLKKVSYELDVTNQQAAEIKQLLTYSQNTDAIKAAVDRYSENVAQLKARLGDLRETSENPNVDKFLQQLTDLSLKHQGLMNDIEEKFSTSTELGESLTAARDSVGEVLTEIPERFESPEKFEKRIERVIVNQGSYARVENALEILGQIEAKLPENAQERIANVRERLGEKFLQAAEEDMLKMAPIMRELELDGETSDKTEEVLPPVFRILPVESQKIEPTR